MDEQDYERPVAYDVDGRPLYAHPPSQKPTSARTSHVTNTTASKEGHNYDPRTRVQYANEPGVRHVTRAVEPPKLTVSEKIKRRHEASKKQYPNLNLSEGEYVILAVRRHPIGLLLPIGTTVVALLAIIGLAAAYPTLIASGNPQLALGAKPGDVFFIATLLSLLVIIFGYMATWIYLQNKFFMTNESVIQEKQQSLFAKHEQTVSLGSIEDASFRQRNILELLLNYGTIRLSTEGEETTYRFQFVSNPKKQIAILNNAVESFKNGRPVED